MSDMLIIPSAAVEALRRKAKKLAKERGVAHHAALDMVARVGGVFPDWHHLIEAAKATEPSERAFKAGLVVGIDVKEAQDVRPSLSQFVRDEQLVMFVRSTFERAHPKPWSEEVTGDWEDLDWQLVYFRGVRAIPNSLDETLELCNEDFVWPPRYVRLRGKVLQDPFSDEAENG
ncbi:MAG: hypothetical protein IH605_00990 [Burkholderiales bacterium]|nr:hypothetical protein [Burkholderiales bacterium]